MSNIVAISTSDIQAPHGTPSGKDDCQPCDQPTVIKPKTWEGSVLAEGKPVLVSGTITASHLHPHTVFNDNGTVTCTCDPHEPALIGQLSGSVIVNKKALAYVAGSLPGEEFDITNSSYYQDTLDADDGPHYLMTGAGSVIVGR